jgi:hypothetical protein
LLCFLSFFIEFPQFLLLGLFLLHSYQVFHHLGVLSVLLVLVVELHFFLLFFLFYLWYVLF